MLEALTGYKTIDIRERNVLFNDALNTFYLRLYGVRHMVKDHSDSEKGNPLPPHGLLLSILIYAPSHRQDNTYQGLCYTNRGALAGTRNSPMGVLIYAPSHRQDNTYHGLCYTSRGALAGTRSSSMGVLIYAPSHRQDSTYQGLCHTSRGALAGTRNSSMGPLHERSIRRTIAP